MTNILIIEDEQPAGEYLQSLIQKIMPEVQVLAILESVEQSVAWLTSHPAPDLIFSDVQLGDGTCFDIFEQTTVRCPIIFTTAHDEYAINAFKLNSIDYLLKPIKSTSLHQSLDKYQQTNGESLKKKMQSLEDTIRSQMLSGKATRRNFLVPYRDKLIPIRDEEFAWFKIENGIVDGMLADGRNYAIDKTLEELDKLLNPDDFFRANRQFIVARHSIQEIEFYFNGRLLIRVEPISKKPILISKERVPLFKKWFEES
ncbi:LytR/AlgR family response regulator transcription factor [Persicitalea jodogahamensis]|uniref:DNA-binding response regulator n=1 Tax=Persicitalea jodogahamensis TaxID=402147 RepID=A0A8J3G8Q5_9BACT|nr:LytTR family DNA-binding domain-containing protein [Persicitalea jodogahamensis]GHB57547.1 DNA-binding response regulator [Persicitalea jodogahamensis]